MPDQSGTEQTRRSLRFFWILTLVAIAASGSLGTALAAHPGPLTGVRVAVSGLVLVTAVTLAARIMVFHDRQRRRRRGVTRPTRS